MAIYIVRFSLQQRVSGAFSHFEMAVIFEPEHGLTPGKVFQVQLVIIDFYAKLNRI